MNVIPEREALREVRRLLSELIGPPAAVMVAEPLVRGSFVADATVEAGGHTFLVEWRSSGKLTPVAGALRAISRHAVEYGRPVIPLVAVPYMSKAGQRRCEEAGASWIDLSGNAHISAPGLLVRIEGRPSRFRIRGRPASVFAPMSSRVARHLLLHPAESFSQRQIARQTKLDEGYVSRIVRRMEEGGLVTRESDGRLNASDPQLLLDAWHDEYDFSKHHIVAGHAVARSGDELQFLASELLRGSGIGHAATGLGAAWLYVQFAAFRLVTFYVTQLPDPDVLSDIGFRESGSGANLWLVMPNDEGVFAGQMDRQGVTCVSPAQVFVDLKGHPERAPEAAAEVRRFCEEKWSDER